MPAQPVADLWAALHQAALRPELAVRVYIDAKASDGSTGPAAAQIATHLRPGIVLRTRPYEGKPVRNRAEFLSVDHRFLVVTSANFSWSAEYGNVELGVTIDNANAAESVEREMRAAEEQLYEHVDDEAQLLSASPRSDDRFCDYQGQG